jgi:predicted alpha/beta-fold hydrolase
MKIRVLLAAWLSCLSAGATAQLFPQTMGGPPPAVTPIKWKWDRLDQDTYFYFGRAENGPLILAVPGAPGDGSGGFGEYLERYLVDEGYAVGVLNWRGDFSRTAKPSAIVARAFGDLARIRGKSDPRFDPNRIVLFGVGEGAFLAMLLRPRKAGSRRLVFLLVRFAGRCCFTP